MWFHTIKNLRVVYHNQLRRLTRKERRFWFDVEEGIERRLTHIFLVLWDGWGTTAQPRGADYYDIFLHMYAHFVEYPDDNKGKGKMQQDVCFFICRKHWVK
jgi:hypothetical protein